MLVLPSLAESFSVVVIEALASGKPVVATRTAGPEFIIDDTVGILTDPDDPSQLTEAIKRVDAEYDGYDPAHLAEFVAARFSLERVARSITRIYRNVVSGQGLMVS